jgi:hypothetical protein
MAVVPTMTAATGPQLALFSPFSDPLHADADWYAINTAIVTQAAIEAQGRAAHIASVTQAMREAATALGIALVHDDSAASACLPVVDDDGVTTEARLGGDGPVVDANRAFSVGGQAFNTDGMLGGALGAEAFATALVASGDFSPASARRALRASDQALRKVRNGNRQAARMFFHWLWLGKALKYVTTHGMMDKNTADWAALGWS